MNKRYIGRFAPSPSGSLHIGSMTSAFVSYFEAKHNNGLWKLRIDDIDEERSKKNYAEEIIITLEKFALIPDEIYFQSEHIKDYQNYLNKLSEKDTYFCDCSRKTLQQLPQGLAGSVYNQTCLEKNLKQGAMRLKADGMELDFYDQHYGLIKIPASQKSDFIIKRKEGFSYIFCCVIDDYLQKITHVVRGSDLTYSTPQQIFIQKKLGIISPKYMHHPILSLNKKKISKSDQGEPVIHENRFEILMQILKSLNQNIPKNIRNYNDLLTQALTFWDNSKVRKSFDIAMD